MSPVVFGKAKPSGYEDNRYEQDGLLEVAKLVFHFSGFPSRCP